MTFGDAIDRARSRCAEVLQERIAHHKAQGHKVIIEPSPRNSAGDIVFAADGLKLPLRYDIVFKDGLGQFERENADSVTLDFGEPLFASWENKMKIEIHRLCWDYVQFEVSPLAGESHFEDLRRWFLKWFDAEDGRPVQEGGCYGVVHFISDPVTEGSVSRFFVDFGSASSDALADLLDEFVRLGADRCVIGRKEESNQPSEPMLLRRHGSP